MDTNTLSGALRELQPEDFRWKFALYTAKKEYDGTQLEWHLCEMKGIADQIRKQKQFLLTKPLQVKPVAPFVPTLNERENIGVLPFDDPLIHDALVDMILSFQKGSPTAPEYFLSGVLPRPAGYAFFGQRKGQESGSADHVAFVRRANPFLAKAGVSLSCADGNSFSAFDRPVLGLSDRVDFLLIGGYGYLITSAIRRDWQLEERHYALKNTYMEILSQEEIFSNFEHLEEMVNKRTHACKFESFDSNILEYILRLSIAERGEYLSTYGIEMDSNGKLDCLDDENCEMIIDLFCCHSCLDPLGRLSSGKDILPRSR